MKLSIFMTASKPYERGDNDVDAVKCYMDLADELIVVNGGPPGDIVSHVDQVKIVDYQWPTEFSWPFIGQQFQRGYEAATGDWVIHADLDYIFHEKDFQRIYEALKQHNDSPAISFYKFQFILPDRYNLKSRLVIAVNKAKFGDRIRFDSGGDLCQPSLDGEQLKPWQMPEAGVPFYNYEKFTKTFEQINDDVERMDRAYFRHFRRWIYQDNLLTSYGGWLRMMKGRFLKPQQHIQLEDHPKYVQETIANLKPEHWGYSGFEELERNDYVKN